MATVLLSNNPPTDAGILVEKLREENRDLAERVDELLGGAERCAVTDMESAGKATLLGNMLHAAYKMAEERQKAAKKPHAELADAAFGFFKDWLSRLNAAKKATATKVDEFRAEQDRKAAEVRRRLEEEARERQAEADRLAASAKTDGDLDLAVRVEQQARESAAQAAEISTPEIRSSYGHLASSTKRWTHTITDPTKIPRQYMSVDEIKIRAAVTSGVRDIPGVHIYEKSQTVFRS